MTKISIIGKGEVIPPKEPKLIELVRHINLKDGVTRPAIAQAGDPRIESISIINESPIATDGFDLLEVTIKNYNKKEYYLGKWNDGIRIKQNKKPIEFVYFMENLSTPMSNPSNFENICLVSCSFFNEKDRNYYDLIAAWNNGDPARTSYIYLGKWNDGCI